jgi:uncharacterized paraquat-inducible protein A
MAQLVFSTINSGYSSTQAYLGTVRVCTCCKTQKPKDTFKMFEKQELCADCREDLQENEDGSISTK